MLIRLLTEKDFFLFDSFLKCYPETSMFLRSNARISGFEYSQHRDYSAAYFAAFQNQEIVGVLALCWNGTVLFQIPNLTHINALLKYAAQEFPQFQVKAIIGPSLQAQEMIRILHLPSKAYVHSFDEVTYALDLKHLLLPSFLQEGKGKVRLALEKDLDILIPWRMAYEKEVFGIIANDIKSASIKKAIHDESIFLLEVEGQVVSKADYNAKLPDIYQIGWVWTPPPFRGKGYARSAVAGALLAAKNKGVQKATLFTKNPSAMKCYESLGFERIDTYHISLLKKPFRIKDIITPDFFGKKSLPSSRRDNT